MRTSLLAFVVLLLAASIGAHAQTAAPGAVSGQRPRVAPQSRPPRDIRETKSGTARISGRVTAQETGAPVRRALVRVIGQQMREPQVTSTDDRGRYELKEL